MSDRPLSDLGNEQDPFAGHIEWLHDTLDTTTPQTGQRPRRGAPWGTLLILLFGLLILGSVAFLLAGPPLPVALQPTPTLTPTATVLLPTAQPTATLLLIPTPTPSTTPAPPAAFGVGDRVVISNAGASGVRLRSGAGLDFITQGIYNDGDVFFVMPGSEPETDYPVAADGYTWWRVRAAEDGLIGWTVEEFLTAAPLITTTLPITSSNAAP